MECTVFPNPHEKPSPVLLSGNLNKGLTGDDTLSDSKYNDYVALLSEDLFPNGNVYYKQGRKNNAMIIHNNWMVGIETKMNKFKEEGYWYL